jgi:tetratricopeptide (TPR) repeat protein
MWARLACSTMLIILLQACATPPQSAALLQQTPVGLPAATLLEDLPFFAQDDYQCGPAALATVLQHSGVPLTPQALVPLVYVPGRKGSFQLEMTAAARQQGRVVYTLAPELSAILQETAAGHPVLVLQNLGLAALPRWHFAVVKGYDLEQRQLILNSGRNENYAVALGTFERTWARSNHWAQVVLPPEQLPVTAEPVALFQALAALQETGQIDTAAAGYDAALQRWPTDATLLMGAGNLRYALGDKDEAFALFQQLAGLHPDSAPAHNNLAQLLLERGDYPTALAHAQRAVALGGDFAAVYQATVDEIRAAAE